MANICTGWLLPFSTSYVPHPGPLFVTPLHLSEAQFNISENGQTAVQSLTEVSFS